MKFSTETEKATGRHRSFHSDYHEIKFNKIFCGIIEDIPPYRIRLQIYKKDLLASTNPNCPWKWIIFAKEFNTVKEAKKWVKDNTEGILEHLKKRDIKLYLED